MMDIILQLVTALNLVFIGIIIGILIGSMLALRYTEERKHGKRVSL